MRFMLPDLYPVMLYMLIPRYAAMFDSVSPACTVYVRGTVAVFLSLWHALSPGYTMEGLPLGTFTFHQSGQIIETYCPGWMVTQLVSHGLAGALGCGAGCCGGWGAACLLPAYACHVLRSP